MARFARGAGLDSIPALENSEDFSLGTVSLNSSTGVVTATISQADAFAALGLDTRENLALGLTAALLGTAETLVRRLRQMTNPPAQVILTGGDAVFLAEGLDLDARVQPELTLEGLRLAHERAGCP